MSGSTILIGVISLECNDKMASMRIIEENKKNNKTDTNELIKKRITTHYRSTIPLIKLFEEKGICFKYFFIYF